MVFHLLFVLNVFTSMVKAQEMYRNTAHCHGPTGRCYWVLPSENWDKGQTTCQMQSGNLATIETEELWSFVQGFLQWVHVLKGRRQDAGCMKSLCKDSPQKGERTHCHFWKSIEPADFIFETKDFQGTKIKILDVLLLTPQTHVYAWSWLWEHCSLQQSETIFMSQQEPGCVGGTEIIWYHGFTLVEWVSALLFGVERALIPQMWHDERGIRWPEFKAQLVQCTTTCALLHHGQVHVFIAINNCASLVTLPLGQRQKQ